MEFVLDASVTLSWFFEDEVTPESAALLEALAEHEPVAPSIWIYEVVNTFVLAERNQRISAMHAKSSIQQLLALPVEVVPYPAIDSMHDLALRHGLTVYDAAYLNLATGRRIPLATRDRRLRAAAEAAGIEVLAA